MQTEAGLGGGGKLPPSVVAGDAPRAAFPAPLRRLFQPSRYKVLYGGRGAGRSWGCARALLLKGATEEGFRVLCARELQNSIADSVHRLLSDQIDALGLNSTYNIEVARIYSPSTGASFSFEGIKNNTTKIKSYEGVNCCWVEEANKVSKHSWGILIPTIRAEGSEIWITFNPELEEDYTYTRFVKESDEFKNGGSTATDGITLIRMTWRDNPWFPEVLRAEMERDRARDPDYYLNVWEGHCIQTLEGAVYAKELRRAQEEGRVGRVPVEREFPVDAFFDLGRADNTAIWFVQSIAREIRLVAYFEESGEDITYFLRELQGRGYTYGTIFLPHDAKAKRLGAKRTIEEVVRAARYRVQIVPKLSVVDGINAARVIFPRCYFDADECADGLKALRHYRYRVIDGQRSNEPLHDWASDGADAFRYLAIGLGNFKGSEPSLAERVMGALGAGGRWERPDGGGGLNWLGI